MKIAIAFLRERKREAGMYAVFAGVFAAVSYLYDVSMDAVQYAFLLSAVWLLVLGGLDYVRYVRRHRELLEVEWMFESDIDGMPEAATLVEEDYQRIVTKLYEARREIESEARIVRKEMVDYYSMWVHQIKTPIAAMHVLLQAFEEGRFHEEEQAGEDGAGMYTGHQMSMQQCGKEMKLELFKIEQYVEMVLTYLRMEGMSSDLSFDICSLDSIIRQAVRKYSQMFILRKIRLEYTAIETKVLTDEKWTVFAIEQILSNALKYTPSGKISIYMEEACLVIEDTGIGIWPEDLPRVFEKGFTGYNGRTDKKSTGIGLYLCKSVMDKLMHKIWIESEAGKGTKVYLSFERKSMRHE